MGKRIFLFIFIFFNVFDIFLVFVWLSLRFCVGVLELLFVFMINMVKVRLSCCVIFCNCFNKRVKFFNVCVCEGVSVCWFVVKLIFIVDICVVSFVISVFLSVLLFIVCLVVIFILFKLGLSCNMLGIVLSLWVNWVSVFSGKLLLNLRLFFLLIWDVMVG